MDSDQNMLGVALELLVVAAILYAVTKGVMGMASALAGGFTMAVMGVGGLSQAAGAAGRGTKALGSGVMGIGRGAAAAGKWLNPNQVKGGAPAPAGAPRPGGWQPAYKQNVIENLQRKRP